MTNRTLYYKDEHPEEKRTQVSTSTIEFSHMTATLTVLEAATMDISKELLRENNKNENLNFVSGKLESIKRSLDFRMARNNIEVMERKKSLTKWVNSLSATVQFLDWNHNKKGVDYKWEDSLCNVSFTL